MDLQKMDAAFERILERIPKSTESLLEEAGERMYGEVIKNINRSGMQQAATLKKAVKKEYVSEQGYMAVKNDDTISPDTYLLENGYGIRKDGKTVGWKAGTHMYRNALTSLEEELRNMAKQKVDEWGGDFRDPTQ